jgi:hypothetical protein
MALARTVLGNNPFDISRPLLFLCGDGFPGEVSAKKTADIQSAAAILN